MKKVIIVCSVVLLSSCVKDPNSPGIEYMPDMYRSAAYETYAESEIFKDSATAMLPPAHAVARGQADYDYPFDNNNEGYELAGLNLKNPIQVSDIVLEEGKVLYLTYCVHCHGEKGDGKGKVPENSDYPNPPAYNGPQLKELPEGKMYHTITYGKNLMGSHASQLSPEERWKVIHYVTLLQNPENPKFSSKSAAVVAESQVATNNIK